MEKKIRSKIRQSVKEKRSNLSDWLETTPQPEKELCLDCEGDQPVIEHIAILDQTLEKVDNDTLGICKVCHGQIEDEVLEIDYTAEICLDDLSEPERRHLEAELEFSSEIQRALLPQHAPAFPGLDIGAFSRPAQIIGGDYFDFFRFKSGSYGLVIADVAGKGFSASLLMSSLQTALRTLAADSDSLSDVIHRINHYFLHNVNLTTFITIFLAQYDPEQRSLRYANAGHNPPLLYRPGALPSLTWLAPTGAAVGVMEEYTLRSETIALQPDDILLLYTDGVTELASPTREFFGPDRLADLVAGNSGLSAQELVSSMRKGLAVFSASASPADDVTIVAAKALG
ncbi:MAG: SpoIIE family protein phosphatase [Anaerolineales bacterium]